MAIKHLSPKTPEEIRQIKIDYLAGVAQSILDNGFFTVAHRNGHQNWSTVNKNWRFLFTRLGVDSERFFWNLEQLFSAKDDYEYFQDPMVEDNMNKGEQCWEEMSDFAGKLQEYLTPELIEKLKQVANKKYDFNFK